MGKNKRMETDIRTEYEDWSKPRIDIFEENDQYICILDLPGISRAQIKIRFHNNSMTVSTDTPSRIPEDWNVLSREYASNRYKRKVSFTNQIDPDHVEAHMKNGMLTVQVPKQKINTETVEIKIT